MVLPTTNSGGPPGNSTPWFGWLWPATGDGNDFSGRTSPHEGWASLFPVRVIDAQFAESEDVAEVGPCFAHAPPTWRCPMIADSLTTTAPLHDLEVLLTHPSDRQVISGHLGCPGVLLV